MSSRFFTLKGRVSQIGLLLLLLMMMMPSIVELQSTGALFLVLKNKNTTPLLWCWTATKYKQTLACLSKLQLLCVHPSLVVDAEGGGKRREMSKDVELSGKLMVLRELLWDAGIGERYCRSKPRRL